MKTTNANPHQPFKGSRVAVLLCWLACFWAGTATPDAGASEAEADENRTAAEDGDDPLARECNWNQLAFGYGETITVVRLTGQRRQTTFEAEVLEEIRGYQTPKRIWLRGMDHLGDSALREGTRWIVASGPASGPSANCRVLAELADTEENRANVHRWVVPAWQYTPIVMVVRVADALRERDRRVVFEVINVLRGNVSYRYLLNNARNFEKFRPLVADGKLHLLPAWDVSPNKHTEHPMVWVESLTEITKPQIAAVRRDLAAAPYAQRIQQIEAGVQNLATLGNAWRFHQAPLVAEVVVNAVGLELSGLGGRHFTMAPTRWHRGQVKAESLLSVPAPGPIDWTRLGLDDLKTRPAYLFYGGGHGYWGKERSGDPFIAAGWKVGAGPVARLPLTGESQKRVRQWLAAPAPTFMCQPLEDSVFGRNTPAGSVPPSREPAVAALLDRPIPIESLWNRGTKHWVRFEVVRQRSVERKDGRRVTWVHCRLVPSQWIGRQELPADAARSKRSTEWMFAGENLPDWTPGSQWFGYWIDRVSGGENPLWQGKMFISNLFLPADTPNDQRLRDVLQVTGRIMRIREAISNARKNRP